MVWTKIESIILVAFYSKHNQLSLSLFTVNPVAIVAQPYSWTNEDHRDRVRQYANSLPWLLFGMTEEQETDQQTNKRSDGRGFYTVQGYAQHSQCAVFLAKELILNQQRLDAESSNRIYENSCSTTRVYSEAAMPVIPGSSLYIFVQSVPVAISMRWDYNYVECQNYIDGIANHDVSGAKNDNVNALRLHRRRRHRDACFADQSRCNGHNFLRNRPASSYGNS